MPDYNRIDPADVANYRQQFKDHLGQKLYDDLLADLVDRQNRHADIGGADPVDLLGARIYTEEDSPFLSAGTALDPHHIDPNGNVAGDFRVLNTALRNNDPARLAQLDVFLRTTSSSLSHFPEYRGIAFRGVDANFPQSVLANYTPGAIVTDRAFTSTAVNPLVPFGFNPQTLFVVNSRSGRDIGAASKFEFEAEILFRPNTSFKVLDVVNVRHDADLLGIPGGVPLDATDVRHQVQRVIYLDEVLRA